MKGHDSANYSPRFKIPYGSSFHFFSFTSSHFLNISVFGPPIFRNFVGIMEHLNEILENEAYVQPFSKWDDTLAYTRWGKRAWKRFLITIGDEHHSKHKILNETRWGAFMGAGTWDSVAGVIGAGECIGPGGKRSCRSQCSG